jgi:Uma2 family endonuclease
MASRPYPLVTVADLECMPDDGKRYEVIEGEIFVSSAPSILHQRVVGAVQFELEFYLRAHPIGILVAGPGVVFSDYDGVIPDLVYVRKERWDTVVTGGRFTGAPDLVIEVLSSGSENERRDRIVKPQLFSRFRVGEYWIVDPEARAIEQYRLGQQGLERVATFTDADELTSPLFPHFRLRVASVFDL